MKPQNNQNHQKPEDIANKLQVFSHLKANKREILSSALLSIPSQNIKINSKPKPNIFISKLRLYVPAAAIFVVVVLSATLLFTKRPTNTTNPISSNLSSEQTAVNGSVDNVINSIGADLESENSLSKQVITDGQTASQEINTAVKQLGDTSNDSSF